MSFICSVILQVLLLAAVLYAADEVYYKIDTPDEIRESSRTLAYDLMSLYKGNQSGQNPGMLPGPPEETGGNYYWWQGGAMMGTYIDYWHLTGDPSYNDVVTQGMLYQVGTYDDYQPRNQTTGLGNDDQAFWGMSAMLAAETRFPNPPADKPQWLALAQAVWNTQVVRWDDQCGGGLHWQVQFFNKGYDYKNTIANGCFFNLGARLARYTNNDTYALHAAKTWDWLWSVGYINNTNWHVYDGGHAKNNCTDINSLQMSYNPAALIQGAAFMYNYTNGEVKWKDRINALLTAHFEVFFPNNTAYETFCENKDDECTADMLSFKGYSHRWLSMVTQIAPFTRDRILPVLLNSTRAAINQCTGPPTGRRCGFYWTSGKFVDPSVDKTTGAGEAMDVLAAVSSLLIDEVEPPVTNETGISKGDPNAGIRAPPKPKEFREIKPGDKVGATIVTLLYIVPLATLLVWICLD